MKARLMYLVCLLMFAIGSAGAADSVTVRLKWYNQAQFAGYYVAQEKGYYRDSGLNVSIQPGGPNFPAIQMIAGGNEQFGVTGADQILVARGKGVPVVALAVIYRKNPFVLFSLKSSGIDKVSQFCGKKIGVKLGGNEELIYRTMLEKAGITKSCLTEVPVQFDLTPLLTKQVDVWPGYVINEVLHVEETGQKTNIIWPDDYGVHLYADTLFTTERMLKEKPDVVKRFVAATLKGWSYAVDHPEEAAKMTVKYGSDLTYAHELGMMKASIPFIKPDSAPIGSMNAASWQGMEDLLLKGGFLKDRLPLDAAYTTTYIH